MDPILEEAFRIAIASENRSMNFYRQLSDKVCDATGKIIFESLAREESGHLESFCTSYPGNVTELLADIDLKDSQRNALCPSRTDSTDERFPIIRALEIALSKEQACIDNYSAYCSSIKEPHIHKLFEYALSCTCRHHDIICEEYKRVLLMEKEAPSWPSTT